jgi:carbon starvation protein CstA
MLATLLPIDKIIGRFYPIFGAILLFMMAGLGWAILTGRVETPAFDLSNLHPKNMPAWPIIFITVSCGAISGFHGTQSPLMSRCLKNERHSRLVFYGAMIVEGLIALVWATVAQGYYGGTGALGGALAAGGPGKIVHDICFSTLGTIGGILAVLGVVVLPVTSGDTAFRVARLVIADYLHLPQSRLVNRYKITVPMFAVSVVLTFVDFSIIWRYFGWANQSLATVGLWTGAVFLAKRGRSWWLVAAVPATFMTLVCVTYILVEDYGFSLSQPLGSILGVTAAAVSLGAFLRVKGKLTPAEAGADESRSISEKEPEKATQV